MNTFSFTDIAKEAYKNAYKTAVVCGIQDAVDTARHELSQYLLEEYSKTSIDTSTLIRVDVRCDLLDEIQSMVDDFEYYEDRSEDFSGPSAEILEQAHRPRTDILECLYAYDPQGMLELAEEVGQGYERGDFDSDYEYVEYSISPQTITDLDLPESVWSTLANKGNLWPVFDGMEESAFDHANDYDRGQFYTEVQELLDQKLDLDSGQDIIGDDDQLGGIVIEALKEGQLQGVAIHDIDLKYLYTNDAALDYALKEIQMLKGFARSENFPVAEAEIVIPLEDFSTDLRDNIVVNAKIKASILVRADAANIDLQIDAQILENISNIYVLPSTKDSELHVQASLPAFGGDLIFMYHYTIYRNMIGAQRSILYNREFPAKLSLALQGLAPSSRVIIDVPERLTAEIHVDSDNPTNVYFRHDPSITKDESSQLLFASNIIFYFSPNIKSERRQGPLRYNPPFKYFRAVEFKPFINAFENDRSLGSFEPGIEVPDTAIFLSEKNLPSGIHATFIAPSYNNVYINTRIPTNQAVFAGRDILQSNGQIGYLTDKPHFISQTTPRGAGQDHRAGVFTSSYITAQFAQSNDLEGAILYRCIFEDANSIPKSCVKIDCVGSDPSQTYKR